MSAKMFSMFAAVVLMAICGTLPFHSSHALSSSSFGSQIHAHVSSYHLALQPSARLVPLHWGECSHQRRPLSSLKAITEKTRSAGAISETNTDSPHTDTRSIDLQPAVTVVAGPGARITSVSRGVAVEQKMWEDWADRGNEERFVEAEVAKKPALAVSAGKGARITSVSHGVTVEHDKFSTKKNGNQLDFGNNIPAAYTDIRNKNKSTADEEANFDDDDANGIDDDQNSSECDSTDDEAARRIAMAQSALLRRAGLAGNVKRSSRTNGRSSLARSHVIKNSRVRSNGSGAGAVGKVLSTVRTAAAAAAAASSKTLDSENSAAAQESYDNGLSTESDGNTDEGHYTPQNNHVARDESNPSKWKTVLQSTVSDILQIQDEQRQKQGDNPIDSSLSSGLINSPPPGTASMGILGDVLAEDKVPNIPPFPGTVLANGNKQDSAMQPLTPSKPQITVRSSIPHSSDDTSIANLRLSVFSRFDEEMQQQFRSRSLEVLNVRRKRGAVVLVAEVPNKKSGRDQLEYKNVLHARIHSGHKYGEASLNGDSVPASTTDSTKFKYDMSNQENIDPALNHQWAKSTSTRNYQMTKKSKDRNNWIIGSVECSHHEFRGTMLGSARPKGSLMYVTEVAVCPETRRCGVGAMLMKGVDEVAALRNVETIYLHVDVNNEAACAMYERCGYSYLDKREPMYAQFTASLNLHDGAVHGKKHFLLCKHMKKNTWLQDDASSMGILGFL